MAWLIGLVLEDEEIDHRLGALLHRMPLWVSSTAARSRDAPALHVSAGRIWEPEPALTLFSPADRIDHKVTCEAVLRPVLEHHPQLGAIAVFGCEDAAGLRKAFEQAGFIPATAGSDGEVRFRRRMADLEGVQDLILDASAWSGVEDVYTSFLTAVGAPEWHGRNLDAINESIASGGINRLEVPYRITVNGSDQASDPAREMLTRLNDLIRALGEQGCPVAMRITAEE